MGKRKPQVGDAVSIRAGAYDDDPWVTATVADLLSVQFTCVQRIRKGKSVSERTLFDFYGNEGVSWKFLLPE